MTIPDIRDGLDDTQRQCLALLGDRYVKSAKVVDDEAGYAALVALAQDFRCRYPLVDGLGNFGSVDDDPPADALYTEMRAAPLAAALPRFPNVLVNGSPTIPPHNLHEAAAAVIAFLEAPDIDVPGLMEHLPGPDFPTGGILVGDAAIRDLYETGHGALRLRARVHHEPSAIVVTELPYGVAKGGDAGVIREIVELVVDGRLQGLDDIQDHTDRSGQRLVLGLRDDAAPQAVLDSLYAHTSLEATFDADLVALVDGAPTRLSLSDLIRGYVDGRDSAAITAGLQDVADRYGDERRTSIARR